MLWGGIHHPPPPVEQAPFSAVPRQSAPAAPRRPPPLPVHRGATLVELARETAKCASITIDRRGPGARTLARTWTASVGPYSSKRPVSRGDMAAQRLKHSAQAAVDVASRDAYQARQDRLRNARATTTWRAMVRDAVHAAGLAALRYEERRAREAAAEVEIGDYVATFVRRAGDTAVEGARRRCYTSLMARRGKAARLAMAPPAPAVMVTERPATGHPGRRSAAVVAERPAAAGRGAAASRPKSAPAARARKSPYATMHHENAYMVELERMAQAPHMRAQNATMSALAHTAVLSPPRAKNATMSALAHTAASPLPRRRRSLPELPPAAAAARPVDDAAPLSSPGYAEALKSVSSILKDFAEEAAAPPEPEPAPVPPPVKPAAPAPPEEHHHGPGSQAWERQRQRLRMRLHVRRLAGGASQGDGTPTPLDREASQAPAREYWGGGGGSSPNSADSKTGTSSATVLLPAMENLLTAAERELHPADAAHEALLDEEEAGKPGAEEGWVDPLGQQGAVGGAWDSADNAMQRIWSQALTQEPRRPERRRRKSGARPRPVRQEAQGQATPMSAFRR